MLAKFLLKRQLATLRILEDKRTQTSCIIAAEQVALKQEAIRGLGTGEGLLLSFAAGCAASIAVRHGAKMSGLRHFPISQLVALLSVIAQLKAAK